MNALEISKALQDVYFMAKVVKAKTKTTKEYVEAQDALMMGKVIVTELSSDQKLIWKLTIENLVKTLDQSATSCTEIRNKLEKITVDC